MARFRGPHTESCRNIAGCARRVTGVAVTAGPAYLPLGFATLRARSPDGGTARAAIVRYSRRGTPRDGRQRIPAGRPRRRARGGRARGRSIVAAAWRCARPARAALVLDRQ